VVFGGIGEIIAIAGLCGAGFEKDQTDSGLFAFSIF
jgi:hypothetical protein